jgi:hypothetical protein
MAGGEWADFHRRAAGTRTMSKLNLFMGLVKIREVWDDDRHLRLKRLNPGGDA